MSTPEPNIIKGQRPEQALQRSVVNEIRSLLTQAGVRFALTEDFGLDIAVFIQQGDKSYTRFIEVKAFVGSRGGGVGFGNPQGAGAQVDLLLLPQSELQVVDSSVRWLLGMGLLPMSSPRYAFFTSTRAQQTAMGQVSRGKQNNLRVADLASELVTWDDLSDLLRRFLLEV